jgi:hypothetical protein
VDKYPVSFLKPGQTTVVASLDALWIYVFAPLTGGLLAGLWQHYNAYVLDVFKQTTVTKRISSINLFNSESND